MCTDVDTHHCVSTSRSRSVAAEIIPEAVLCPWRCAEVAAWLTSLMAPAADYCSQTLQLIYVIAAATRMSPFVPRVRAFLRYTVTLDETTDPAVSQQAWRDLAGRLRCARDSLWSLYSFIPVPATAVTEALSAQRCSQPVVGLRYAAPLPVDDPLAPPNITPVLDYLVCRPGCAALEFRVERRSSQTPIDSDDTDEATLRFGVVALGEAADEVALERLVAQLCGSHSSLLESASGATPKVAVLRPATAQQRAQLYTRLTAPAEELQSVLEGAAIEDVTLSISEAGGRIAMPHRLF